MVFEVLDGKLRTDEEGNGVAQEGVAADGEKLHRAVVAYLLKDLEFAGFFAQDNEALRAEDFFGQRGKEFFEILWLGPELAVCSDSGSVAIS